MHAAGRVDEPDESGVGGAQPLDPALVETLWEPERRLPPVEHLGDVRVVEPDDHGLETHTGAGRRLVSAERLGGLQNRHQVHVLGVGEEPLELQDVAARIEDGEAVVRCLRVGGFGIEPAAEVRARLVETGLPGREMIGDQGEGDGLRLVGAVHPLRLVHERQVRGVRDLKDLREPEVGGERESEGVAVERLGLGQIAVVEEGVLGQDRG